MTEKEKRMRAYSQNRFAALETALYLDTHPTDRKALAAFWTYAEEAEKQRAEYEEKFGRISLSSPSTGDVWTWISGPWPWQ